MNDWTKARVWALVTSHPAQRMKGCSCHQEFLTGHPMSLQASDGPEFDQMLYVAWNPKCPWHGVENWKGKYAGDCWPTDEEWYAAWEKKRMESSKQTPNLTKLFEVA